MFSYIWNTKKSVKVLDVPVMSSAVTRLVPLLWREHCMECAMPLCYKTCELYKKRMDGRCIRFEHGVVPVKFTDDGLRGAEIEFRRWAKLQSDFSSLATVSPGRMRVVAGVHSAVERFVRIICNVLGRYRLCQITASLLERINTRLSQRRSRMQADGFLAIICNCEKTTATMLLDISVGDREAFRTAMPLQPGWNEFYFPVSQMNIPSPGRKGAIRAYLEDNQTGRLVFRRFDFVKLAKTPDSPNPAKKVKCVAWDLDNTIWDGIIGEVGADGVAMKSESVALVKALDERGIIQTIASKNTREIAWPKLEAEGLAEYFLYPAINWGRKSESLKGIAKSLNINIDTFALIDDSSFERNEVKTSLPQVRVYDVTDVPGILGRDEFDIPVTEASRRRRLSYKEEEKRNGIKASWGGDYDSFLRSCELKMDIFIPAEDADFKRCLELLNRSNQYNISGKRYADEELKEFVSRPDVSHYAFRVKDKYGDYGIVGYATVVQTESEWKLVDFVMSCRVAQKKIERAFIGWLRKRMPAKADLSVRVKKSDRNKPLQDEFRGMPFHVVEDDDKVLLLSLGCDYGMQCDEVVEVIEK